MYHEIQTNNTHVGIQTLYELDHISHLFLNLINAPWGKCSVSQKPKTEKKMRSESDLLTYIHIILSSHSFYVQVGGAWMKETVKYVISRKKLACILLPGLAY